MNKVSSSALHVSSNQLVQCMRNFLITETYTLPWTGRQMDRYAHIYSSWNVEKLLLHEKPQKIFISTPLAFLFFSFVVVKHSEQKQPGVRTDVFQLTSCSSSFMEVRVAVQVGTGQHGWTLLTGLLSGSHSPSFLLLGMVPPTVFILLPCQSFIKTIFHRTIRLKQFFNWD